MTFVISRFSGQPGDRSVDSITRPVMSAVTVTCDIYNPQRVCKHGHNIWQCLPQSIASVCQRHRFLLTHISRKVRSKHVALPETWGKQQDPSMLRGRWVEVSSSVSIMLRHR